MTDKRKEIEAAIQILEALKLRIAKPINEIYEEFKQFEDTGNPSIPGKAFEIVKHLKSGAAEKIDEIHKELEALGK